MQMLKKLAYISTITLGITLSASSYAHDGGQCNLSLMQFNPDLAPALQNAKPDHYITICGINYFVAAAAPCYATATGQQCKSVLTQVHQTNPMIEQGLVLTYNIPELGTAISGVATPVSAPMGALKNYFG